MLWSAVLIISGQEAASVMSSTNHLRASHGRRPSLPHGRWTWSMKGGLHCTCRSLDWSGEYSYPCKGSRGHVLHILAVDICSNISEAALWGSGHWSIRISFDYVDQQWLPKVFPQLCLEILSTEPAVQSTWSTQSRLSATELLPFPRKSEFAIHPV